MNRYAQLAALRDLDTGRAQRVDLHGPDDRVLDGNHRVVRVAPADCGDRVGKGATGHRNGAGWPLLADGEITERTQLALEGHARIHAFNILTWHCTQRSLHGMTRHRSARYWYYTPTRMGSGVFCVRD